MKNQNKNKVLSQGSELSLIKNTAILLGQRLSVQKFPSLFSYLCLIQGVQR